MNPYRIPQQAKPYTDYDMIQRHTELPPFADARASLLHVFLQHHPERAPQDSELYTLVTGLVQLALDTHEAVDRVHADPGGDAMRSRQLKVLAGDYFSGWFYQLLAARGEVEMVGRLAAAIADYNVMKAGFYTHMKNRQMTAEPYFKAMVQLNIRLFLSFTPLVPASETELWKGLLYEIGCCETAMLELRRCTDPADGIDGFCYWHMLEQGTEEERKTLADRNPEMKEWRKLAMKYKGESLLSDKLHRSLESARGLLTGAKDETLLAELRAVLDRFAAQIKISGQASGEG